MREPYERTGNIETTGSGVRALRVAVRGTSGADVPAVLSQCCPHCANMEGMRVLVVEDNSVVADAVAEGLRDQGMAVDVAYDGPSGLEKAVVNTYDVVVLDRDLPGLHGDKFCEQIVISPCPSRVLMLTAAGQVEDRVEGLNLGADDYLAKPFDFSELVARVRALARRAPSTPPVLTGVTWSSTGLVAPSPEQAVPCRWPGKNWGSSKYSCPRTGQWSAPSSFSNRSGTRTRTPSPRPSRSPLGASGASSEILR
jgi:CheY-like chemotaxis protein